MRIITPHRATAIVVALGIPIAAALAAGERDRRRAPAPAPGPAAKLERARPSRTAEALVERARANLRKHAAAEQRKRSAAISRLQGALRGPLDALRAAARKEKAFAEYQRDVRAARDSVRGAYGPDAIRRFRAATQRALERHKALLQRLGKSATVDREKLRQEATVLARSLHGDRVSPKVGPNREVVFRGDHDPYAGVGRSGEFLLMAGVTAWYAPQDSNL